MLSTKVLMQFKNNVTGRNFHETLASIFGFSRNNQEMITQKALQENH
jgi:hypothetical protein